MKIFPVGGWSMFHLSNELIDSLLSLHKNHGWHYMGFTTNTMVVESPLCGSTIYLGMESEKVIECVIYETPTAAEEFREVVQSVIVGFQLADTE